MAFSLPADLATNWADNVGMIENAAYLNAVGTMGNALKAAMSGMVSNTATAVVATQETVSGTSYTDLATTTDSVTVTIGASGIALVIIHASLYNATNGQISYMSFAASGANTIAASDSQSISVQIAASAPDGAAYSGIFPLTGLSSSSTTTFKAKYRATGGTGKFSNRRITVIPIF